MRFCLVWVGEFANRKKHLTLLRLEASSFGGISAAAEKPPKYDSVVRPVRHIRTRGSLFPRSPFNRNTI